MLCLRICPTAKSHAKNPMSRPRLIGLLLALVTLLAYLPASRCGFTNYDDDKYVTENRVVQNGLTRTGIQWAFTTWYASNWHPLTWLSHMLDYELFGPNAGAQHCVNVLFHTVNAVLLLLLLFRTTGALWPSAFVAALFAWHPLHVESVAWIAERKDVLSTFFEMLALLAYTRHVQKSAVKNQKPGMTGTCFPASCFRPPASLFYWLALIFFALGLMAKPMLVTLPFILLLLDYWPLQRLANFKLEVKTVFRLALEEWPFFLLAAASCVVTLLAQRRQVVPLQQFPLDLRLGNAFLSYVLYFGKAIWPTKLAVIYPLQNKLLSVEAVLAAVVFLALFTWLAWRMRRRHPYLLVGWLWFLGTLVPVIGLVQVGQQAMADRYTYVPLIGVFIPIAFGGKEIITRFQIGIIPSAVAVGLILGSCLVLTEQQLSYWKNSEMLFAHAVAVTKNNSVAHFNLGVALEKRGCQTGAIANYQEVLRLSPGYILAHNNLGNCYRETGETKEALAQYQEEIKLNPKEPLVRVNLGILLASLGRLDEAMSQYEQAAQLDPGHSRPYYLMGKTLLMQGHDTEAVGRFREALRLDPNDLPTLILLASVLASSENPQIRNGAEAVALAEKANVITGGGQSLVLDTLAMSYAEAGRFKDAQQIEQQAIQLAQAAGLKETNVINRRLELYQSGQPYRETFTNAPPQRLPKN